MTETTQAKTRRKSDRPSALGLPALDTADLIARIEKGLPYSAWERLVGDTAIPREVLARAVQVSLRTLSRRKEEGRLHPDESDRLVRIARIVELALVLFDDNMDMVRAWLTAAQLALRGSTPLEYASTEIGSREVEDLIGRLEHGIPS